jgi:osmotically-inducible protein OsmY
MKTMKWNVLSLSRLAGVGAIAVVAAAAGCGGNNNGDATAGGNEPGNTATGKSVDQNLADTANAVSSVDDAAANAAKGVGNAVSDAGKTVAGAAKNLDDAATVTPAVKSAFAANKGLTGSKIDVDTTDTNVTLSGTVKSQAQKGLAAKIAQSKAAGYKVVNNLKVAK